MQLRNGGEAGVSQQEEAEKWGGDGWNLKMMIEWGRQVVVRG